MADKDENEKKNKKTKNAKKAKKAERLENAAKTAAAEGSDGAERGADRKSADTALYADRFREIEAHLKASADSRLAEWELNVQQAQALGYIHTFQEDGIIQNDLAKQFGRTGASISSMLQGLEKKGFVRRVIPEGNERQKKVYVTEKAEPLIPEINRLFAELEQRITAGLTSKERDLLDALLEKVKSNL
ncbi:MarR family winged helix-turn-helix transcriptional regulator [Saccharibacillus deserti]|uniref:MarR family winged helix-turn-helix transcriptional regulator n=1 Tax=Saccharibacillus deserti TaxID=1634444 RepID=UPI001553700C|nr:MarR family transcriptional regulator [Saccharibacillus deserti]